MNKLYKSLMDNPVTIETAIEEAKKSVSFSAQIMAQDFSLRTLEVLIEAGRAYARLKATKFLTFSDIGKAQEADYILETLEDVVTELIAYIYENSNKHKKNIDYLKYAFENAMELSEERINKLFNLLTVSFAGKKVDKRKAN